MSSGKTYTTPGKCRVCGSTDLTHLFSLGEQFVSDFVEADKVQAGHRCPIELELCRRCTLVQARHTAPQDFLYTRHYWYTSGTTQTMRDALRDVVESAMRLVQLDSKSIVLDIGSNDNTLLNCYPDEVYKVGFEPATNLVPEDGLQEGNLQIFCDFWNESLYAAGVGYGNDSTKAMIITACGMLYDMEDPSAFIADVAKVLHPNGVFIAQLMCLKQMLDKGDVGNLAHEHLEFYSLRSLRYLLGQHKLTIFDIEENSVNGGSYRLYVCHRRDLEPSRFYTPARSERVRRAFEAEKRMQLSDPQHYADWFARVTDNRDRCVAFIRDRVAAGRRVWILGASTKGNVIAQWYGLDTTLIEAAADRSPAKHSKCMVGTGIPIKSEEEFREARPDFALVLPYAFIDEITEREKRWRRHGGWFIVPLPEWKLV